MAVSWQQVVEKTVAGLGYDLVDCERSLRGLLVVFIDRLPGQTYITGPGDVVTVDDCEQVTRQLQYVLEVEGCAYERLEVSSPGVDRPLRRVQDYERFLGEQVDVTLKVPFQGRKKYQGRLRRPEVVDGAAVDEALSSESFELVFSDGKEDQVLGFVLNEVREARLVPVLDFKGRKRQADQVQPAVGGAAAHEPSGAQESGGHEE